MAGGDWAKWPWKPRIRTHTREVGAGPIGSLAQIARPVAGRELPQAARVGHALARGSLVGHKLAQGAVVGPFGRGSLVGPFGREDDAGGTG